MFSFAFPGEIFQRSVFVFIKPTHWVNSKMLREKPKIGLGAPGSKRPRSSSQKGHQPNRNSTRSHASIDRGQSFQQTWSQKWLLKCKATWAIFTAAFSQSTAVQRRDNPAYHFRKWSWAGERGIIGRILLCDINQHFEEFSTTSL